MSVPQTIEGLKIENNFLTKQLADKEKTLLEKVCKIGELEKELTITKDQLQLAEAKLNCRPSIEYLERKIFPSWLLAASYPVRVKWIVALEFQLTNAAQVILERMRDLKQHFPEVSVAFVAETFATVYDSASEQLAHNRRPSIIKAENWRKILSDLHMVEDSQQALVEKITLPIVRADYDKLTQKVNNKSKFLMYVNNLLIDVGNDGEFGTDETIGKFCDAYSGKIERTYYVQNDRNLYTNEVFIKLNDLNKQEVLKIQELLAKHKKPDGRPVFIRTHYLY